VTPRLAVELIRRGFRRHATYRAATLAGVVTNTMFGFLRGAVLVAAIDAAAQPIAGYDRARALTYVWLGQALIAPIAIFRWTEIADRIRTGELAGDLSRPADFQGWWLCDDLGRGAYQCVARGVTQLTIGALVGQLAAPASLARLPAFVLSVGLAVVVSFGLRFLVNVWVFWTLDARGPTALYSVLAVALSGFIVPIDFYPDWLVAVQRVLPFASLVQGPIDVWIGTRDAIEVLALQLLWAIALLALGRVVVGSATRRLVVQGG
jgi:ABC-2 type transport system permease protein